METNTANQVKTPFNRLVAGMLIGEVGMMMALLTPISLLLTLKFMELDPHNATTAFGMVTGAGALFAMFANPIGGAISDRTTLRFGRRRTWILIGSILGALCLTGIALSKSIAMIAVFWCLTQIVFNFVYAAFTALLPDQVDEGRRGSISGVLGLAVPFSPIIGLVIMTVMGNTPLSVKYIVLAVISVVTAVVSCILIREGRAEVTRKEKVKEKMPVGVMLSRIYPSPRKYPVFTWGWLTRFFISLAYCSNTYNSIMLMRRYHFSQAQTTATTTLLAVIGMGFLAISSIVGGMLSDKLRKQKPFVAISALVVGVGLIFNAVAPSVTFLIIGNVLGGLGYGIYLAVDMALVARILPNKKDAAKDFGIMNIANTITQSIVPFIGVNWPPGSAGLIVPPVVATCALPMKTTPPLGKPSVSVSV